MISRNTLDTIGALVIPLMIVAWAVLAVWLAQAEEDDDNANDS